MKKNILITALYCFGLLKVNAQMETYNWHFGSNCHVSFVTGNPVLVAGSQISEPYQEGCSSMSDGAGNVLFYTDGSTVWNAGNTIMANGTGLMGFYSSSQGALIVPKPGTTQEYFIFSLSANNAPEELRYAVADMTLSGGLGAVTVKNILVADSMTEKQIAIRHQNGNDYWLVTHKRLSNEFQSYLISASGVSANPVVSAVGTVISSAFSLGCMKATRSGNKIAAAYYLQSPDVFEVYDFDNATGMLSNPLTMQSTLYNTAYSVEFSADGNFLYGSCVNNKKIYQFDLQMPVPPGVLIATPLFSPGDMLLAPDGKIYIAFLFNNHLGVINAPDSAGAACNFVQNGFGLGRDTCQLGLPNFVHDLITLVNIETPVPYHAFTLYPNPAHETITISNMPLNIQKIEILDFLGQTVFTKQQPPTSCMVRTATFAPGLYVVSLFAEEGIFQRKLVIQ